MRTVKLMIGMLIVVSMVAVARAQSADDIVAKYIEATGGVEKWKSLETLVVTSRSPGSNSDLYWKAPNFVRAEDVVEYPGLNKKDSDIRSFDGTTGWRLSSMEGSDKPRHMSQKEILGLLDQVGEILLYDYKRMGYKIDLVGKENSAGKSVYRLKIVKAGGDVVYLLIDDKSFLPIKRIVYARVPWDKDGKAQEFAAEMGDYRAVGGLMFPHRVGGWTREYHLNVSMDVSGFRMPGQGTQGPEFSDLSTNEPQSDADQARDPQRRAELLKSNPEADINKNGVLDFEEAWAFLSNQRKSHSVLSVGAVAPDWVLKDSNAKPHRLSDYKGKVVVMDFWAVWCTGCHRAMPWLQKMHTDLAKRGVVVIGISTGENGGDPVQLMKDRGYTYELMLNGETIAAAYGVDGLPTFYVVGIDGLIIYSGTGANERLEQQRRVLVEGYLTQKGM